MILVHCSHLLHAASQQQLELFEEIIDISIQPSILQIICNYCFYSRMIVDFPQVTGDARYCNQESVQAHVTVLR